MHQAERGLFELRRGRSIHVTDHGQPLLVASVESLTPATLERLRGTRGTDLRLVVTEHRARALGIPIEGTSDGNGTRPNGPAAGARSLALPETMGPEEILRLCSAPGKLPSEGLEVRRASTLECRALDLARLGRLLPAVLVKSLAPPCGAAPGAAWGDILRVPAEEIAAMAASPRSGVELVSEARVPLAEAEEARFLLFREANGLFEHVAVRVGNPRTWPDPLPVRLHSACITGDLFGSLRCDCGEQLRGSMKLFVRRGGGVLLYLAQEGRSIGFANKLRAYAMQEDGLDTVDADCSLGFGADERRYDAAVQILGRLGIERVRLLTNNPEKVRALERGGIRVVAREGLHGSLNRHNLPYVRAKAERAGHWLDGMLSQEIPRA